MLEAAKVMRILSFIGSLIWIYHHYIKLNTFSDTRILCIVKEAKLIWSITELPVNRVHTIVLIRVYKVLIVKKDKLVDMREVNLHLQVLNQIQKKDALNQQSVEVIPLKISDPKWWWPKTEQVEHHKKALILLRKVLANLTQLLVKNRVWNMKSLWH